MLCLTNKALLTRRSKVPSLALSGQVSRYSDCLNEENFHDEAALMDFSRQYFLSELLPYDPSEKKEADLRIGLKEYKMLLSASLEALHSLAEGNLSKFDCLVGENACEIRAVWIAIIASKKLVNIADLKTKIDTILKRIENILDQKTISRLMHNGVSLKDLLINENLLVTLNFEANLIIQSFLLAEAKVIIDDLILSLCLKEKCDSKKLKRFGDISSSFAHNLLTKFRKFISTASVQYVRERAYKLRDANLINMLSDKFTINHNNYLPCTPMFWTYKSILSAAKEEGIPLIISAKFLNDKNGEYKIIDEDLLFFEPVKCLNNNINLIQKNVTEIDYNKAVWVVQGVVLQHSCKPVSKIQWRQLMTKYSIASVILAGAADHRQYPDPEQDELISSIENPEYEAYKAFAKSDGFSFDNPTTFFIRHVFPSRTEDVFSNFQKINVCKYKLEIFQSKQDHIFALNIK